MAVTTTPITKITIDSKNFQEKDPVTGAFLPKMNANVFGQADQLLSKAERVLQSTINAFEGFNTNLRTTFQTNNLSDPKNPIYAGRFSQSAYINTSDRDNAMRSLQSAFNAKISYDSIGDAGFDIKAEDAVLVNITKSFKNRKAQMKAIEELDKVGGTLDVDSAKTKKNPYRSVISVPMSKTDYDAIINNNTQKEANKILSKYVKDTIPRANKENRLETSRQNAVKKEKEAKEAERKEKQKEKEEEESKRKTTGTLLKILAVLGAMADLLRRVVTTALANSIQTKQDAITGHNLGLTTEEVRRYKYFDIAHGMEGGTTVGAMSALQSAFGLGQEIDTAKLEKLAPVLRGDTANLARTGVAGGEETNKLLGMILTDYLKQYLSGKNSLNQYESNPSVRRANLVSNLNSAFPELGTLFGTMLEDYESGIYKGKFSDYTGWLSTTKTNQGGMSDAQLNAFQEMGALLTSVNSKLKDLTDKYLAGFALSLVGLVQKVDNIQFGKTATEKNEQNKTNKQLNLEARESMRAHRDLAQAQFENTFRERFGFDLASTGLTISDLISYKDLNTQNSSVRATKIREFASRIIYGDNADLLAYLASYEQYNKLYEQANTEAQKTSGKVDYNKSDYVLSFILKNIEKNIQEYSRPKETGIHKVQGQTVGSYKNLVSRLRDTGADLSVDEKIALNHGLINYLSTYGDIEAQLSESGDNDFLDEIALLYNAQNPDNKIAFNKGLYSGNMSKEGREKFEQLFKAGAFTDDMLLQAYINLLSGKGNAVTRRKDFMNSMENAFYESQYDAKTTQASSIALSGYVLGNLLTKSAVDDIREEWAKKGYTLDNKAVVYANSDNRTLDITLYGTDNRGNRKELQTIHYGAYDSSVDKAVDVDLSNLR